MKKTTAMSLEKVIRGIGLIGGPKPIAPKQDTVGYTYPEYPSLASAVMASRTELRKEAMRDIFSPVSGYEHRLEDVLKKSERHFINDSAAYTINATWYALETMSSPVIWILGGRKQPDPDYPSLYHLVKEKVRVIICISENNQEWHEHFQGYVDCIINPKSLKEGISLAYNLSKKGDAILFSPASPSFDRYHDYKDRGNHFKQLVYELFG